MMAPGMGGPGMMGMFPGALPTPNAQQPAAGAGNNADPQAQMNQQPFMAIPAFMPMVYPGGMQPQNPQQPNFQNKNDEK